MTRRSGRRWGIEPLVEHLGLVFDYRHDTKAPVLVELGAGLAGSEISNAVKAVEEHYDANVFLYSAGIDNWGYGKLVESVSAKKSEKPKPRGLLILTTGGGSANSAYQIARFMHQAYDEFILFTPSYCKSAGTLIALGAHRLIMDGFSELGPLDVQLLDRDEIGARKSGLLTRSAFEALSNEAFDLFSKTMMNIKLSSRNLISFKLAADISWRLTGELLAPVFAQMNPDVIGSDFRDLQVATEYGSRLGRFSQNLKPDTVRKLVSDYPSHDFIIDRDEAQSLFKKVDLPSEELYDLMKLISGVTYRQASPGIVTACSSDESLVHDEEEATENVGTEPKSTDSIVAKSRSGDRKRNKRPRSRGSSRTSDGTEDGPKPSEGGGGPSS